MKYGPIKMRPIPTALELKLVVLPLIIAIKVNIESRAAMSIVKVELSKPISKTGFNRLIGRAYKLNMKCLTHSPKVKLTTAMAPHLNNCVVSMFGSLVFLYSIFYREIHREFLILGQI